MDQQSTTQIFLRIAVSDDDDAVIGEGRLDRYADRIVIESFDFSMSVPEQGAARKSSEEGDEGVEFEIVSIKRPFDLASNRLSRLLKDRTKFTEARLTVDQQMTWGQDEEKEQNAIIVFHLLNGQVAEQTLNASEGDKGATISETIKLRFENVEIEYYLLNRRFRDGALRNYREVALPFASHNPVHND